MDLTWFKDLAAIHESGSFSRAAESTHISQSAFSRRIRSLESWVGATLVERARHPVRLTAAGMQMLEAGTQALERVERERDQIRNALEQPDRYVVTFGTQHSIGWRFFPSWLQSFEGAYGPFMSRLRADNLPNCIQDLRRGEVDFVISYESRSVRGLAEAGDTDSLVIGTDELIPVSVPDADGSPLFNLDALVETTIPYLAFDRAAPIGRHLEPQLASAKKSLRLQRVYENAMAGALRIRARDGLGLAWLSRTLVEPDLSTGALCVAGCSEWWVSLRIHLSKLQSSDNRIVKQIWRFLQANKGNLTTTNA